ncbi:MAG: YbhB/YbcL family Raf kinase inhibitor-like protein [Chloroflexota bacterium]
MVQGKVEGESYGEEYRGTTLSLWSIAFANGERIPEVYTFMGEGLSPPLAWSDPPEGTKSFAMIVDDLDEPLTGMNVWVLFNMPAHLRELPSSLCHRSRFGEGIIQGVNDHGRFGYGAPCPTTGPPHRYRFHLYALDTYLDMEATASREQVLDALEGHILAKGQLVGACGNWDVS